jgi:competence protein ComEC
MFRKGSPIRLFIALLFVIIAILYSNGYLSVDTLFGKSTWEKPSSCGNLEIHVLNVSQADAFLIKTPGNKTILVDSASAMKKNSATKLIQDLNDLGVYRIDYIIATHFHEDHIGGMKSILPLFDVGSVYTSGNCGNSTTKTTEKFLNYSKTLDFKTVNADLDLPSDGCYNEAKLIVAYDRQEGCFKNENDNSILLRLVYGNTSFLFTGDCEEDCEEELIKQGTKLKSDFLKVSHHGSSTSSTDEFLHVVNPAYAVISTDMNRSAKDRYFHPRKITMEKLHGMNVYRTDLNGDIKVISDGSNITIHPESQADGCEIFKGYVSSNESSYSIIPKLVGECE